MMDVSGSMGDEQKEIVRIESFWIDTWLRSQYHGIESRYIIHDAMAKEVDRDTFFKTRESGGTMISSAYKLCAKMIADEYPAELWNIYPFHFSDGDNWSVDDTHTCVELLKKEVLPYVNLFCVRPGRVALRLGAVHQGPDRALRRGRARRHERDQGQGRDHGLDQGVPREGQVDWRDASSGSRRTCATSRRRSKATRSDFGLDFFPILYEVLDYKTMNEVAAYGGFPTRYPHWRFGMDYEQLSQELRVGPVEDLRDGDQHQPGLRVPARGQLDSPIRRS